MLVEHVKLTALLLDLMGVIAKVTVFARPGSLEQTATADRALPRVKMEEYVLVMELARVLLDMVVFFVNSNFAAKIVLMEIATLRLERVTVILDLL